MVKQTWNIGEEERKRILNLHETATKNLYLVTEQEIVTKKVEPKSFLFPNTTFPSGQFANFDKNAVDKVLNDLNSYLKNFPLNQQIDVEIESSESRVPNRGVNLNPGELSNKRAEELSKYIKEKLPKNVVLKIKSLGPNGPSWSPPKNATADQIRQLANNPRYTKFQYVKFNVVGSGESQEEICDLGFSIIVDYRKEWCKPGVDESRCHKCNEAVFRMWANGIPLTTKSGSDEINLNNREGSEVSGPTRIVELVVSSEQKDKILSRNPDEIMITFNCALNKCHSDPAHITIINSKGVVLLPPQFITTGVRLSNQTQPINLIKLNKCGQKIAVRGESGMESESPSNPEFIKPTPSHRYDGSVESVFELYKLVNQDGTFLIPQDKADYYRRWKKWNGKPWQQLLDSFALDKKELRLLQKMIGS